MKILPLTSVVIFHLMEVLVIKDSNKSKQRTIEFSLLSFMRFDLMMGGKILSHHKIH